MEIRELHRWDVTPKEAVDIQERLRKKVSTVGSFTKIRLIAGADVSYARKENSVHAAVGVFSFPDLRLIEQRTATVKTSFPYIPGLLTFREGPALIECFKKIKNVPDAVIFDGQGICHPRRMGIASHMGVLLDIPSIGCAKSHLYGEFRIPVGTKGSYTDIQDVDGTTIGACLRTRTDVKPVFVSTGHDVSLNTAINTILRCTTRYRIPEPSRFAHTLAEKAKTGA